MDHHENDKKRQQALDYHSQGRPGKIEVTPTKPFLTNDDLSKAYSPGVAWPCLEISKNPEDAYKYTAKGNLVGVISNGTAVLGLGNIGALAGKPVMEGKGILFKRFADIDVFDIEVNEPTIEGMVRVVKALEPTFGGVNLEDIKAPECFEIEQQLVEIMDIPVFHDDQHGTAIIAAAAFLNALEVTKRDIKKVKVVFSGAGAAAIACARLFLHLGVKPENLIMTDSKGVVYKGRKDGMNKYKDEFAVDTKMRTLADAMDGADAFVGCSARGVLTKEMVKTMAKEPIIFAMANPDPEILPDEVAEVRNDAIMATGRSDFPNQVNNVLGFPFIFRGALDVKARKINIEMKLAAVYALAELAKEEIPDEVRVAYGNKDFKFGREYLIPKPFDSRVLTRVTPAVAKAAMDSGVARVQIPDMSAYVTELQNRLGQASQLMSGMREQLKGHISSRGSKTRMVFAEGSNTRILQAVKQLKDDNLIAPVLLGNPEKIHAKMKSLNLYDDLNDLEIIWPQKSSYYRDFVSEFVQMRQRSGVTRYHAEDLMIQENYFGSMLIHKNLADCLVAGPTLSYADCLVPILNIVGTREKKKSAAIYMMVFKNRTLFFADCAAQVNPSAEELSDIAVNTAELFRYLMKREPRIAFLSFSNFGSSKSPEAHKVKQAVKLTRDRYPEMKVEGEVQADVAVNKGIMDKLFDFSTLDRSTDILIFPELNSANISYKLLSQLSNVTAIGPLLVPMTGTTNIIQRTATVAEIVNMCTVTALLSEEEDLIYKKGSHHV
ncbi:MAG: NADP-dependent malic enzyme [Bdellovibrio sp. CG12_big_fil_rev_8_21_14_0_65_39_13]|nr:MAG: NADP-dependent malic enzyme [Bdellovibrio sp. CG22_combo_CG10-13_8_21_14_all_39_27]PIQ58782.1 MAG: NADP-dependent malic enzyme [Bdellovibrio sp. CG12_big_fil_rev_8_21_14_0_65_39_13]PIR35537.1 MAG: NADP-dependent malic enzyme [Bdellovibrio sp. CG11_big_fil_rev_8_21_14_0_20_39_38]